MITRPLYWIKKWCLDFIKKAVRGMYIYICFGFADGKHYIIKYNKELFESFEIKYIVKWNATNSLVPLILCITLDEFVDDIKRIAPCCYN